MQGSDEQGASKWIVSSLLFKNKYLLLCMNLCIQLQIMMENSVLFIVSYSLFHENN